LLIEATKSTISNPQTVNPQSAVRSPQSATS
jgi:hypothetical protein